MESTISEIMANEKEALGASLKEPSNHFNHDVRIMRRAVMA